VRQEKRILGKPGLDQSERRSWQRGPFAAYGRRGQGLVSITKSSRCREITTLPPKGMGALCVPGDG
jgi:hypothetical protein